MKRVLTILLAAVLLAGASCIAEAAPALTSYVAPHGDDANSGMKERPFATLAKARDASRAVKVADASAKSRIVVRGGEYFLDAPLELTADDSDLTIEAAPSEKPVLYGGRRVTGWRKDGENYWAADLPDVKADKWNFRMLVVNGRMCARARLPQTGEFTHLTEWKVPWIGSETYLGWERKPTQKELSTMIYRPEDLGPWLDVKNAELTVYAMFDEAVVGLAAMDAAKHTFTFSNPCEEPPGARDVKKYVVWNVREGLTEPGRWYLDRTAGKVVYWPPPGEDMTKAEVLAPTMESVIRIQGNKDKPARNITLRGLTVSLTSTPLITGGFGAVNFPGAIAAEHAADCDLKDLTVVRVAGQGIKAGNVTGLRIENCEVFETGASGVMNAVNSNGSLIRNNHVHHVGLIYPSGVGIFCKAHTAQVSHNEVHDTPYCGLCINAKGSIIEANLVYRAMQQLHDGAGIYLGKSTDLIVRGNVVRDIVERKGGYGMAAYYFDRLSRDCLVEGNVSLRVNRAIKLHRSLNHTLRGNLFVVDGDAEFPFAGSSGVKLDRNVFHATGKIVVRAADNGIAAMPNNIFHSGSGAVTWWRFSEGFNYKSLEKDLPLQLRDGSIAADPLFEDAARGDLRFRPGSPALKLGITTIDVSQAGRSADVHPPHHR